MKPKKISSMELSEPFRQYSTKEITVRLEIDLDRLVDENDYHDFPSSVDIWLTEKEFIQLQKAIKDISEKIEKLKEKNYESNA